MDKQISKRADFNTLLNNMGLNGKGVEVGVQRGLHAKALHMGWKCKRLYLVDPWEHQSDYKDIANVSTAKHIHNYRNVQKLFAGQSNVELVRDYSVNAAERFSDETFDFIYLDARHDYEGIMEDLGAWFPKLKKGGVFAGHDYLDGNLPEGDFGVKKAVQKFHKPMFNTNKVSKIYSTDDKWPSWYFFYGESDEV